MKYEVVFSDNSSTTFDMDKRNGDSFSTGIDGVIYVHTKDNILLFSAPIINIKYIKQKQ